MNMKIDTYITIYNIRVHGVQENFCQSTFYHMAVHYTESHGISRQALNSGAWSAGKLVNRHFTRDRICKIRLLLSFFFQNPGSPDPPPDEDTLLGFFEQLERSDLLLATSTSRRSLSTPWLQHISHGFLHVLYYCHMCALLLSFWFLPWPFLLMKMTCNGTFLEWKIAILSNQSIDIDLITLSYKFQIITI